MSTSYRPHRFDVTKSNSWVEVVVRDKNGRVKYIARG